MRVCWLRASSVPARASTRRICGVGWTSTGTSCGRSLSTKAAHCRNNSLAERLLSLRRRMFDLYQPSEEHEEIRAAVRNVVEKKIAPYAAEVDADSRYPQEAHDALVETDFFAAHIPEEYGGMGADALAVSIIIRSEERRVGKEGRCRWGGGG